MTEYTQVQLIPLSNIHIITTKIREIIVYEKLKLVLKRSKHNG